MEPNPVTTNATLQDFFSRFEAFEPTSPTCALGIGLLRQDMDKACDAGTISIKEWRSLHEKLTELKSQTKSSGAVHLPINSMRRRNGLASDRNPSNVGELQASASLREC